MTPSASLVHYDQSRVHLDLTMLDEPPVELSEQLYFAFHDDFVSATEIDTLELLDCYQRVGIGSQLVGERRFIDPVQPHSCDYVILHDIVQLAIRLWALVAIATMC